MCAASSGLLAGSGTLPNLPIGWWEQIRTPQQYGLCYSLNVAIFNATGIRPFYTSAMAYATGIEYPNIHMPTSILEEITNSGFMVASSYTTGVSGGYGMWIYTLTGTGIPGLY